jgi:phosphoserine phosphatase RsbU/P
MRRPTETESTPGDLSTDTVEELPFVLTVLDAPDSHFLYLNRYTLDFLRELGIPNPRDIIGTHPSEIVANWEEAIRPAIEQAQISGETQQLRDYPFEWMGRTTYWDVALIPYVNEHEEVTSISVIGVDVTERKQAENALKQSEERFRLVIARSPDTIFMHDRDLRYVQVYNSIPPASREQLQGKTDFEVFPEEEAEHLTEIKRGVLETGVGTRVEVLLTIGGSKHLYDVSYEPWKDEAGQVVGIIGYARDITEHKQLEEDLRGARDVAEREMRRVAALENISQAGITATNTTELLGALAERMAKALDVHSCTIMLLDEQTGELVSVAAYNLPGEVGFRVKAGSGLSGKIATEQRTVYVADAEYDPLLISPYLKREGVKSLLGTPLFTRRQVIGVTYLGTLDVRAFSPEESRLFEIMAARAALVIDNARLYDELLESRRDIEETLDRELHFSHLLQQALLPPMPTIGHGYHTAHCYVPAFASREVGGDFYDVFTTEDGKEGILIGDVSGKGIEAAAFAAATRSTVRAFAHLMSSPGGALTNANSVLRGQCPESEFEPFVTVFLAVLDRPTGHLVYSGAGHPPPAVYRAATGTLEFLQYGDPPIGLTDAHEFRESESDLDPGDKVVLYTDGLSEARSDSGMFGSEGIEEVLRRYGHLSPDEVVVRLLETAKDWARGHLTDDTAIIVVEREGE